MTTYAPPGGPPAAPQPRGCGVATLPRMSWPRPKTARRLRRPGASLPEIAPRDAAAESRFPSGCARPSRVLVTVAAVAWPASGALVRYTRTSPRFAIRTVQRGRSARTGARPTSRASGGITVGANIFALDLASRPRQSVERPLDRAGHGDAAAPRTDRDQCRRARGQCARRHRRRPLPATRDGELFKKLGREIPYDFPIVTGILADDVVTDRAGVVAHDQARARRGRGVRACRASPKRSPSRSCTSSDDGALVVVGKEAARAPPGKAALSRKVEQAARVLAEVRERHAQRARHLSRQRSPPRAGGREDAMKAIRLALSGFCAAETWPRTASMAASGSSTMGALPRAPSRVCSAKNHHGDAENS